jgi:hypothetical protein
VQPMDEINAVPHLEFIVSIPVIYYIIMYKSICIYRGSSRDKMGTGTFERSVLVQVATITRQLRIKRDTTDLTDYSQTK